MTTERTTANSQRPLGWTKAPAKRAGGCPAGAGSESMQKFQCHQYLGGVSLVSVLPANTQTRKANWTAWWIAHSFYHSASFQIMSQINLPKQSISKKLEVYSKTCPSVVFPRMLQRMPLCRGSLETKDWLDLVYLSLICTDLLLTQKKGWYRPAE